MKNELSEFDKPYFRKIGSTFKLRRKHCEGEIIPTEEGQFHWWVRTPQGRFSGEEIYLSLACADVLSLATRWENTIPSDDPPLPVTRPDRDQ